MSKGGKFLAQKVQQPGKKRIWLIVLACLFAVILIVIAVFKGKLDIIPRPEPGGNILNPTDVPKYIVPIETQPEETTAPPETTVPEETTPDYEGKMGKIINVLLIGQDAREGEGSKNADTVILVTVNKETKKVTMTSFLRDTYVTLNNVLDMDGKSHSGHTKLTLVYALGQAAGGDLGAMTLMDNMITQNFGPVIDHNIEVNMEAFDACINALGGVTVTLDEDEANYMNKYFASVDEDRVYEAGENKLDGWAAEVYVRTRHANNGDNDFNRTDRQRAVVSQVLEKVKHMSVLEINKLVDSLLPMVLTDMSNTDIINYIMEILPVLPQMTLESIQCPNEEMGRWGEIKDIFHDGMEHSILHFDANKAKEILIPITEGE